MINTVNNLKIIQDTLKNKIKNYSHCNIIAVSKTFPIENIFPLINDGHIHFGENKVQEALTKWTDIKKDFQHIKLHMIGKLQSNKVKFAVSLFDYIHSLDSLKLAEKISIEQKKFKKNIKIFIQINIGNEEQKNGIPISEAQEFYKKCINDFGLNIIGFMCLPPNTDNNSLYFSKMEKLISESKIKELSMGMSGDYMEALDFQSTFLRIGSCIFGKRV